MKVEQTVSKILKIFNLLDTALKSLKVDGGKKKRSEIVINRVITVTQVLNSNMLLLNASNQYREGLDGSTYRSRKVLNTKLFIEN